LSRWPANHPGRNLLADHLRKLLQAISLCGLLWLQWMSRINGLAERLALFVKGSQLSQILLARSSSSMVILLRLSFGSRKESRQPGA
jgi:hypothetical protein